ncbi:MAG: hypothetical protein JWQ03_3076 [Variovorax sp.]|nr:hypothetical protein [Variovorax sp.]
MVGARRSGINEADFRRIVDEIKAQHNISDLVGRSRKLHRAGKEVVALCAFHPERSPSMRINDAKGTYHCFGCGASGDAVRYVMQTEGLGFIDSLKWLGAADLPIVDPASRARAAEEDAAERAAAVASARAVWDCAVDPAGTAADVYARSRGITTALPPSIRFATTPAWYDKETGEAGPDLPALIGAVTRGDELVAVQRIFLSRGGRAKANMKKPKLSLGRVKGGALKLDGSCPTIADASEIIITEGPEDGLSLAQEMPDRRVWVALGTALMPEVQYPPDVRSIVIAGQNDDAGRHAALQAADALIQRGFKVRTMYPDPAFKDWNDQLRGIRK